MNIEDKISRNIVTAVQEYFQIDMQAHEIQFQETRKEFEGDLTYTVFPLVKLAKKSPEQIAQLLGEFLKTNVEEISNFNIVKGFLNISLSQNYWNSQFSKMWEQKYGYTHKKSVENSPKIMIEYSSPNTNKPLHLGHIRNNLLGYSVAKIFEANGYDIIKTNLVNDRGIHICKSMVAWELFGKGETPSSSGIKGDHLVGKYYVAFDAAYKSEIAKLQAQGFTDDEAKHQAPIMQAARQMLVNWEAGDEKTLQLWNTMNSWVYEGFASTYNRLGVSFDTIQYESQTYLLGKQIVIDGLEKNIFYQKDDSSIWIDLTDEGLDHKLLLRPDGTSVYMTQDIGTAVQRFEQNPDLQELIYVVGNEQNYHFQVLTLILKKLGYKWYDKIFHLSYGMVELPEGKMKSREGTVVDADDLMEEMLRSSIEISNELGKLEELSEAESAEVHEIIAQGALKYFMLKVDPKKNMLFNPKESIDFNGNTGPFIQYTYTRIQSVIRKSKLQNIDYNSTNSVNIAPKEKELIIQILKFNTVCKEAAQDHSPAQIANYTFELVKMYNQFYHDYKILSETNENSKNFRLQLSELVGEVIKTAMGLLGIKVPSRM